MRFERPNKNIQPPASKAVGGERTIFGANYQADTLEENYNEHFLRGWGVVGPNDFPPVQWFNAIAYTLGALVSHLYQNGVPEWSPEQEYYKNSMTLYKGKLYLSKVDEKTVNKGKQPDISTEWSSVVEGLNADVITSGIIDKARLKGLYPDVEAGTAVKLSKARKINGVYFDGTKDIETIVKLTVDDLNTAITYGEFFVAAKEESLNFPIKKEENWWLKVYSIEDFILQKVVAHSNVSQTFLRSSSDKGKTWSDWAYSYAQYA